MQTQTSSQRPYEFPVSLQKTFTAEGHEVPRARAVVRGDTNKPISVVSSVYRLITHKEIMDQAFQYVKVIGEPQVQYFMKNDGAQLTAEFTFMDKTLAVRKGEMVGLRVYVDNNYQAKGAMKVRIGGLCMWCMNGAINHRDVFDINVSHIGKSDINFPAPELVMEGFKNTISGFKELSKIDLSEKQMIEYVDRARADRLIPGRAVKEFGGEHAKEHTAWALYNYFTYVITHQGGARLTQLGRINRLNRVGRWFQDNFLEPREKEVVNAREQ